MSSDNELLADLLARAEEATATETEDFDQLASILGLDPKTDFAGADLADLDFTRQKFHGCDFRGTDFFRADLSGCLFDNCDLRGATLVDAHFGHAVVQGCDFSNALLRGATFEATSVDDCRFVGADLRDTHFVKSPLNGLDLQNAVLTKATFIDSTIRATDVSLVRDAAGSNIADAVDVTELPPAPSATVKSAASAGLRPSLEDKHVRGILFGVGHWGERLTRAVERQADSLGLRQGDERDALRLGVPYTIIADDRDPPPLAPLWAGEASHIIVSCGRTGVLPKLFLRREPTILVPRQNAEAADAPPPLRPTDQVRHALEVLHAANAELPLGRITLLSAASYSGAPEHSSAALERALLQGAMDGLAWEDATSGLILAKATTDPRDDLEHGRVRPLLRQFQTGYQPPLVFDANSDTVLVLATFDEPRTRNARPIMEAALAPHEKYRDGQQLEPYSLAFVAPPAILGNFRADVDVSFLPTFPTKEASTGLKLEHYVVDPALLVLLHGGATEVQKRFAVWSSLSGRARKDALREVVAEALHRALKNSPEKYDIFENRLQEALTQNGERIFFIDFSTRRSRNGRALHCAGTATYEWPAQSTSWDFWFELTIDMDSGVTVTDIHGDSGSFHDD